MPAGKIIAASRIPGGKGTLQHSCTKRLIFLENGNDDGTAHVLPSLTNLTPATEFKKASKSVARK
jgi:hypothetical protein